MLSSSDRSVCTHKCIVGVFPSLCQQTPSFFRSEIENFFPHPLKKKKNPSLFEKILGFSSSPGMENSKIY